MTRNDLLYEVGNWMLVAGSVPLLLSIVLYGRKRWWVTAPGRAVMGLLLALGSVYAVVIGALFDPDGTWRGWLRLVVFTLTFAAFCYLAFTMIRPGERRGP